MAGRVSGEANCTGRYRLRSDCAVAARRPSGIHHDAAPVATRRAQAHRGHGRWHRQDRRSQLKDEARKLLTGDTIAQNIASIRRVFERRSEEHTSELQSLMRLSYAVFCLKKKTHKT